MADLTDLSGWPGGGWWREQLAGRYLSSWPMLCSAVASNMIMAADTTSKVISQFRETRGRVGLQGKKTGILFANTVVQYNTLIIGPVLGALVLSVFAIESFLWLVASCKLARCTPRADLDKKLLELDKMAFGQRLKMVLDLVGLRRLPDDLWENVRELSHYRNFCAHDTPQIYGEEFGKVFKFHKPAKSEQPKTAPTPSLRFPLLADEVLPLSLEDALWAADTHDRITKLILTEAGPDLERYHRLGISPTILELAAVAKLSRDQIRAIDRVWDAEVRSWFANITPAQFREITNELWGEDGLVTQTGN